MDLARRAEFRVVVVPSRSTTPVKYYHTIGKEPTNWPTSEEPTEDPYIVGAMGREAGLGLAGHAKSASHRSHRKPRGRARLARLATLTTLSGRRRQTGWQLGELMSTAGHTVEYTTKHATAGELTAEYTTQRAIQLSQCWAHSVCVCVL